MKKGQTAAAILLLAFALNGCGGGVGKTAFAPTETAFMSQRKAPSPAQMWKSARMIITAPMN